MKGQTEQLAIIGGGIQGMTLALALAGRGIASVILERSDSVFSGASLRNEGKLHLGFVYALDSSARTASQMIEGALTFTPLLERWCGEIDWNSSSSGRFAYAVMDGGLADAATVEAHYGKVSSMVEESGRTLGLRYLGSGMSPEVRPGRGEVPGLRSGLSSAWFDTPERSVDPRLLRRHLTGAMRDEPLIEVRTGCEVLSARRTSSGIELTAATRDGRRILEAEKVVNCSWDGRAVLDRQVLGGSPAMCYRVKHQVVARGRAAEKLRPLTMVQGPYGDLVPWPNGDVYVSWYPVSRTWFGDAPKPDLRPDPQVAEATLAEMKKLVPGLAGFEVLECGAAHIVAAAESDIDDSKSGLHSREVPPVGGSDGWWSLSSGKLTTAPLASERCAALITGTSVRL